ncbi:MAG: acyl-CoA dehydrogenase family protein [Burkholderiaceae bacterium]|nr:acyl-CoA dehydrogenase family protein [Burkholderiaceae bacterium]
MSDRTFLDWPFLDSTHRALAEALDAWAASALPGLALPHDAGNEALDAACRRLVASLGDAGLLQLSVPAPWGGRHEKLDVRSLCLARDTLARHHVLADFAFAMQGLGSAPITLAGSDAQKKRFLPDVARGRSLAAFALSEPDAGSDVAAMRTKATRDADGWRIDGSKTWISNAGIADFYTVFARVGDEPGAKNLAAFVVPADTPGLDASARVDVIAPHPLGTLHFDGCRVPDDALIDRPGAGFRIAMATLDVFRSTVGAAALGMARRALDEALARTRTREVFGQKLAEFQLTQAKIAEMALAVDAAALLVYRAAWTKDTQRERVTREASMAKLYATESAQTVIDQALQLFGGTGVIRGAAVEELYREIRALRIYEGTSEIQKLVIAAKTYEAFAADAGN